MNSKKKDKEIKLRVTTQEKEQIKKLSSNNMSAYILKKVFAPDSDPQKSIAETVETLDLVNTIMLEVEKSADELLKKQIRRIIAERI